MPVKNSNYSLFSNIYAHLMKDIDYKMWGRYLIEICENQKINKSKALEIGGGLGNIATEIVKDFNLYILSDLSADMLKLSRFDSDKIVCDMRNLPFKNKFDIIFATFDSVNYLTDESDFIRFLNCADDLMDKNSILTFDVSTEKNCRKIQKQLNRKGVFNNFRYSQISEFQKKTRIHQNIVKIWDEKGTEHIEVHNQKIYEFFDYFKMIERSNLYVAECFDCFSFEDADDDSDRMQFVLKQKRNIND
ncbi:MAG: class I SAM-dependent methyltransferase [Melioribacteraceae bacterium]|nr:class I SAM-dependent methyltransferase [Melioribacteraceae bacterium]MCF8264943.1 class I SAM-dependent methyltransferase [Melioribacteraceae bacterium]MCF8414385.1 class I SAM-dependent methyltransferase [Melioribacteraceae bacterium]MCF8432558.1 class I SAM-dependent methyltransferase [Melioribacteraceae bacterium]